MFQCSSKVSDWNFLYMLRIIPLYVWDYCKKTVDIDFYFWYSSKKIWIFRIILLFHFHLYQQISISWPCSLTRVLSIKKYRWKKLWGWIGSLLFVMSDPLDDLYHSNLCDRLKMFSYSLIFHLCLIWSSLEWIILILERLFRRLCPALDCYLIFIKFSVSLVQNQSNKYHTI